MKKLFDLFTKQKNMESKHIPYNSIEFLIDDGEPNVKLSVIDISDDAAKLFAQMIYDIVNGKHELDIVNILLDLSSKDKDIQTFVTKVLIHYSLAKTMSIANNNHRLTDDPVIKPTDFNKHL